MSKKGRKMPRDTPGDRRNTQTASIGLTTLDAWRIVLDDGYTPLYECPEVRMCVNAYADLISSMTIHLVQNTDIGDKRVRNELSRKVDINPCDNMTRKSWVWNIVNVMLTKGDGNCVVYPEYNRGGYLENLIPLNPDGISFVDTNDGGYLIQYFGETLKPEEVLHFKMNPDPRRPWIGTGTRITLREAVKSIRQANATKNALLESPAPSLVVKVDGLADEFHTKEGRDKLAAQYIDQSRNGRPWIVPADLMQLEQIKPLTVADLAIKDNIEIDRKTIAGIYSVPPYMVGIGVYNKDEHRQFINTHIMGFAQYIQQELTAKLIYSPDWFWRFNPRSLMNYDLKEMIEAGLKMNEHMAMDRNEVRDWAGLDPREDMAEMIALENYIPVSKLGDQKKLKGGESE